MNSSNTIILLILALVIALCVGLWWWSSTNNTIEVENNGLVETPPLDTKTPAGVPDGWFLTQTPIGDIYSPLMISSDYVNATDWPPSLSLDDAPYSCTEAGEEIDRAGGTNEVTVNGRSYCRTVVAEGAAGSVYRQYAYVFPHEGQTAILTFSARFPQCANYEEEEADSCEAEQSNFNPDDLADRIIGTIIWK